MIRKANDCDLRRLAWRPTKGEESKFRRASDEEEEEEEEGDFCSLICQYDFFVVRPATHAAASVCSRQRKALQPARPTWSEKTVELRRPRVETSRNGRRWRYATLRKRDGHTSRTRNKAKRTRTKLTMGDSRSVCLAFPLGSTWCKWINDARLMERATRRRKEDRQWLESKVCVGVQSKWEREREQRQTKALELIVRRRDSIVRIVIELNAQFEQWQGAR